MAFNTQTTAEDIADLIAAQSWSGSLGEEVFVNTAPATKPPTATMIQVTDSGGEDDEPIKGVTGERPSFQVRVSAPPDDDTSALQMLQRVKELLHTINPFTTSGGTHYSGIWTQGGLLSDGKDNNQRPEYIRNFRAHRGYN